MEEVRPLLLLVGLGFFFAAMLTERRTQPEQERTVDPEAPGPYTWPKPDRRTPPPQQRQRMSTRGKVFFGIAAICVVVNAALILLEITGPLW